MFVVRSLSGVGVTFPSGGDPAHDVAGTVFAENLLDEFVGCAATLCSPSVDSGVAAQQLGRDRKDERSQ